MNCRNPEADSSYFIVDASWEEIEAIKMSPGKRWQAPQDSNSLFKLATSVGNMSLNVVEKFVGKPLADTLASVIMFISAYCQF